MSAPLHGPEGHAPAPAPSATAPSEAGGAGEAGETPEARTLRQHPDCDHCRHSVAHSTDIQTLVDAARILAEVGAMVSAERIHRSAAKGAVAAEIGCLGTQIGRLEDAVTIRDIAAAIKALGWLTPNTNPNGDTR